MHNHTRKLAELQARGAERGPRYGSVEPFERVEVTTTRLPRRLRGPSGAAPRFVALRALPAQGYHDHHHDEEERRRMLMMTTTTIDDDDDDDDEVPACITTVMILVMPQQQLLLLLLLCCCDY